MVIDKRKHLARNSISSTSVLKRRLRITVTPCSDRFSNSATPESNPGKPGDIDQQGPCPDLNGPEHFVSLSNYEFSNIMDQEAKTGYKKDYSQPRNYGFGANANNKGIEYVQRNFKIFTYHLGFHTLIYFILYLNFNNRWKPAIKSSKNALKSSKKQLISKLKICRLPPLPQQRQSMLLI